jgi:hypothetical protein
MMGRHVSIFSTGLLLCGLLLISGVAPVLSQDAGSLAPHTTIQEVASGGSYRLVGMVPSLHDPAGQCTTGPATASVVQDPPAGAGRDPAWTLARGDVWPASGATSGGGYHLTGWIEDQGQGDVWQARGSVSGGAYSLRAPAAPATHIGSGCCCTYLPAIMHP